MGKLTLNEFKWLKRDLELRMYSYQRMLSDLREKGGKDDSYMKNLEAKIFMMANIFDKFNKIERQLNIDVDIV